MRPDEAPVCSIIPPHILRNVADRGDEDDRQRAHLSLELSAHVRGERHALGGMPALLAVAPGRKRRTVYDARGGRDLPGRLARAEGAPPVRDRAVNEAYDGAGKTYDFFRKVFGRNSIDDHGLRLDATVHYGTRFANAQWDGRQMIYGDGDGKLFTSFTSSLEVIGHELSHGVVQHTAGLAYRDQPGALNEHFADVFGVLVKQHAKKQRASRADWLIGVGLFTKQVQGEAVRSMKAPGTAYDDPVLGKDPQPSHMRAYVKTSFDSGGVHVNSGIPNHAFYRLAMLLGGNAWDVAGRIWYHTLTRKLQAKSRFQECADATLEAAGELYGVGSEPQDAVLAAWKAVGITAGGPRLRVRAAVAEFELPTAAAEMPQLTV